MGTRILSTKQFTPTPPDKGSFPLDHDGLCKSQMMKYSICLLENNKDNSACRMFAKDYLQCRMENNLMTREEWPKLGYSDSDADDKAGKTKP